MDQIIEKKLETISKRMGNVIADEVQNNPEFVTGIVGFFTNMILNGMFFVITENSDDAYELVNELYTISDEELRSFVTEVLVMQLFGEKGWSLPSKILSDPSIQITEEVLNGEKIRTITASVPVNSTENQ